MTAKNGILLMIKQSPGIEYNALLSRVTPNYGSVNSARAALSRAIKDMRAVGWIEKRDNHFFATEKGQVLIQSEMKNKLLLKLNQTLQSRDRFQNIDSIVEQLAVLIERSKADADLLKAAKSAANFSISDLKLIHEQTAKRLGQLHYLQEVFQKQIDALQQLDFLDSVSFSFHPDALEKCRAFLEKADTQEIVLAASHPETIEQLAVQLNEKAKSGTLIVNKEKIGLLFESLNGMILEPEQSLSLSASNHQVEIKPLQVTVTAPHQKVSELKM